MSEHPTPPTGTPASYLPSAGTAPTTPIPTGDLTPAGATAYPGPGPTTHRAAGRPRRPGNGRVVLASLLAGVVGGLGGGLLAETLTDEPAPAVPATPGPSTAEQATRAPLEPVPADGTVSGLARAVLPSVALISIGPGGRDGQGSGFVIREDGYLLTNHHVIAASEDGTGIAVELPGRDESLEAEVVGSDSAYDIAVLRVAADDLEALEFADPDLLEVGQTVVAVGAPLGLDSTVTSGIVSALDRPVVAGEAESVSYINAIQTDAAINPGNSGGPLLDLAGRVVGVNSAIAQLPSSSFGGAAGSIGLGFAIPADVASRTATQLIETGRSEHPVMGVHIDVRYTEEGARVLAQSIDGTPPVVPGGPADVAGVRPGDVIVSVDGTRISDFEHLLVVLRSHAVGESVEMLLRGEDGRERTVQVVLAGSED